MDKVLYNWVNILHKESWNEVIEYWVLKRKYHNNRSIVEIRSNQSSENFIIRTVSGKDITPDELVGILSYSPIGLKYSLKYLRKRRKWPFTIKRNLGMSGCEDYALLVFVNESWERMIHAATLHVSMSGRLNQGVDMYIGDLLEILAAISQEKTEKLLSIIRQYENNGENNSEIRSDEWEDFYIEEAEEETYTIRPQLSLDKDVVAFNFDY